MSESPLASKMPLPLGLAAVDERVNPLRSSVTPLTVMEMT